MIRPRLLQRLLLEIRIFTVCGHFLRLSPLITARNKLSGRSLPQIWGLSFHHPRDPVSRSVLILAGGFSDPSTWVPDRLNASSGVWRRATAPSLASPEQPICSVHSAPCGQPQPHAGNQAHPVTDRNRTTRRLACVGFECHPWVTFHNQMDSSRGIVPTALSPVLRIRILPPPTPRGIPRGETKSPRSALRSLGHQTLSQTPSMSGCWEGWHGPMIDSSLHSTLYIE